MLHQVVVSKIKEQVNKTFKSNLTGTYRTPPKSQLSHRIQSTSHRIHLRRIIWIFQHTNKHHIICSV